MVPLLIEIAPVRKMRNLLANRRITMRHLNLATVLVAFSVLLAAFCLAQKPAARPEAKTLPEIQLRARVAGAENVPAKAKHAFSVSGVQGAVNAPSGEWSPWITIGTAQWENILKAYPNSYLRRFPVVFGVQVHAAKPPVQIELEVQSPGGTKLLQTRAELFGSRLGLLLYPDETGQFRVATQADYNQRYWQAFGAKPDEPAPKLRRLLVVDRFIGGDDDRRAWEEGISQLARAGFSAIMVPPSRPVRDILARTGSTRTSWAVYNPPGYAFPFDPKITPDSIQAWANQLADSYRKAGFEPTDMALFAMSDEPGWYYPAMLKTVREQPQALAKFRDYLRKQGLQPADVGAQSWEDVVPIGRSQARDLPSRRLFYWSARFYSWESARHFSDCVRALEKAFYPNLPVFTNWNFFAGRFYVPGPVANNADKNHPDAAMGGHDWFEFARLRGGTILWTEDWFSDARAYQWSFYCAKLRCAAAKANLRFGGYVIPRTAGDREDGIVQKILCVFGHGGQAVKYFVFGPEYNFPGNCYSEKAHLLKKLREAHSLLAAAEDYLAPGRMPPSPVAILMPRSAQVWDCKEMEIARGISDATNTNLNAATVDYMAEVFDLYLALQHANIPVDFVDEDDLTAEGLQSYRVVYVTEPNVPREGQAALLKWMRNGGVLVTISNAATADRYDDPCSLIADATGIAEKPRPRLLVANAANLPAVARLQLDSGEVAVYGVRGELLPGKYEVLARFTDGLPAIVRRQHEKGAHIHYAFLPGIAYWRSSTQTRDRLPVGFSEPLRTWISYPLRQAQITPPAICNHPLVETPVLLSDKGAAVTVLNWTGEAIAELELRLRLPFAVRDVRSARGAKVSWQRDGEQLIVRLPITSVDILLLDRSS
jgi:hypothetical protein